MTKQTKQRLSSSKTALVVHRIESILLVEEFMFIYHLFFH